MAKRVARDKPNGAVSDSHGKFSIRQLPVERWRFRIWQEQLWWISNSAGDDRTEAWEKGYVEIAIGEGENDSGEIRLLPLQIER